MIDIPSITTYRVGYTLRGKVFLKKSPINSREKGFLNPSLHTESFLQYEKLLSLSLLPPTWTPVMFPPNEVRVLSLMVLREKSLCSYVFWVLIADSTTRWCVLQPTLKHNNTCCSCCVLWSIWAQTFACLVCCVGSRYDRILVGA